MALYHELFTEEELKNIHEEMISWRREIHENPDLSGEEQETVKRVSALLTQFGVEHEIILNGEGVIGIIRGGKPGPVIALRADMDALPIKEETGATFASKKEGVMHACGHDIHTATLLGVVKALALKADSLSGTVKLFFQPNEERDGGAERMIALGCMDDPKVDYVLGLHVHPFFPPTAIGVKYGIMYVATDGIDITIKGLGAHGAHPENGIDAIAIAAKVITNLQMIVSRITSPLNPVVVTIGTIQGGSVPNQIADRVRMMGMIRTVNDETRVKVKECIKEIAEKTAEMYGATAEVVLKTSYDMLINDSDLVDLVKESAEDALGKESVIVEEFPEMGAEDFAYFAKAAPGCFIHLGCRSEDPAAVNELHNACFMPDEECLLTGLKVQINNVLSLMK